MQIEKSLLKLGFEEKESKIYLTCLQLGPETAFNIAKRSGLKRSTAYFVLNQLTEKGLISVKQNRKNTKYIASNPKKLITQLKHKQKVLDDVFPMLTAIYNYQEDKPNIQVYEGEEGVRQVCLEMLEDLKKVKEVIFFGDVYHAPGLQKVEDIWFQESKKHGYKIRELLNYSERNGEYAKMIKSNKNPSYQIKFIPKDLEITKNNNAIFGNKLAIFSTNENQFVTVIESSSIANAHRSLFELAWNSALE